MPDFYRECQCGDSIAQKRWRLGKRDCVTCAIARCVVYNTQMKAKRGNHFQGWLDQMRRIVEENTPPKEGQDDGSSGNGSVNH